MKEKFNIRYEGLDFLKLCCCIFVIIIHLPINGVVRDNIVALCRCAVPIFFMISGYFYKEDKLSIQIKKIIKYIIIANIVYFCFYIIINYNNLNNYLNSVFTVKEFIKFLIFNGNPISDHLWYLNAILYVYIILYVLKKLKINQKRIYILIPFLLCLDLILGKYSLLIFNINIPFIIVRNFMFVGLPYFLLGNYINEKKIEIKSNKSAIFIFIFIITTLLERNILCSFNVNAVRDHYISTTFLALFVFMFFLKFKNKNKIFKKISEIGKKYSTNIYIYHYLIIKVVEMFF